MKSLTWVTFALTSICAALSVNRVALDQPARDLAGSDARKVQQIVESATVVRVKEMQDFQSLSQALKPRTGER